jgi:hypothetical protein
VAETLSKLLTDDAVVTFVARYTERNGMGVIDGISADTSLTELGLDSITTTGLLIAAHQELIAAKGLPESAKLTEIPPLERVGDLAELLRGLSSASP